MVKLWPFFLCCLPTVAETVISRSTSTGASPPNDRVSCSTTSSVNLGSALTCSTICAQENLQVS